MWLAVAQHTDRSRWTRLLDDAVKQGGCASVREGMVDTLDPMLGATPIMYAVRSGNDELVRLLLQYCSCRMADSTGENATIWALKYRNGVALELTAREWLSQLAASHFDDMSFRKDVKPTSTDLYR